MLSRPRKEVGQVRLDFWATLDLGNGYNELLRIEDGLILNMCMLLHDIFLSL